MTNVTLMLQPVSALVSAHSIKSYLIFLLNIFCKLTVMAQKIGTLNLSDIKDSLFPVS